MTESHPPHPTDEALSAAIDGYDEDARVHAEGCERCRYRIDAMRGVAQVLSVPPPVLDAVARERAIAQAVRVRPEVGPQKRWGVWLGAAAAVLALLVAAPLVLGGGDDSGDTASMEAANQDESATGGALASSGLGSFDDPGALRTALAGVLGEGDALTTADAAGSSGSGDERSVAAPSTTTTAPPPASDFRQKSWSSGAPCTVEVQRDYGDRLGEGLYSSGLTWQGQTAVVLVYRMKDASGSLDKLALVLRQGDCQLLTSVSL